MMKYTAVTTGGDGFTFEAENDEKALGKAEKAFRNKKLILGELINNTKGTTQMFGSKAVAWLYSEN